MNEIDPSSKEKKELEEIFSDAFEAAASPAILLTAIFYLFIGIHRLESILGSEGLFVGGLGILTSLALFCTFYVFRKRLGNISILTQIIQFLLILSLMNISAVLFLTKRFEAVASFVALQAFIGFFFTNIWAGFAIGGLSIGVVVLFLALHPFNGDITYYYLAEATAILLMVNGYIIKRKLFELLFQIWNTHLRDKKNLEEALEKVRTLKGLIPICSHCKKVRDDKGYWEQVETYVGKNSSVEFSHSICPNCARELYDGVLDEQELNEVILGSEYMENSEQSHEIFDAPKMQQ